MQNNQEPTATQLYHSRINEVYLMTNGCYNYKGNLLQLHSYTLKNGMFQLKCIHYLDKKGNYKFHKGIEIDTLGWLAPCSAQEEMILLSSYTPEATIDHFERMYFNAKSKGYGKDSKTKSKAYFEGLEELSKEKEERPKEIVNIDCGISEIEIRDKFKNGKKSISKAFVCQVCEDNKVNKCGAICNQCYEDLKQL